jgi:hypothetical protein
MNSVGYEIDFVSNEMSSVSRKMDFVGNELIIALPAKNVIVILV